MFHTHVRAKQETALSAACAAGGATDFGAAEKWLCKFIYAWHALLQQNHISC